MENYGDIEHNNIMDITSTPVYILAAVKYVGLYHRKDRMPQAELMKLSGLVKQAELCEPTAPKLTTCFTLFGGN